MPCFTLKIPNFYLAKKSLIVSTGVDSIKFQKTISPAAGTELFTYATPRAPCWSHILLPTRALWGECRETENSKQSNTSFQQYRGVEALKTKICLWWVSTHLQESLGRTGERWRAGFVHSILQFSCKIGSTKKWHHSQVASLYIRQCRLCRLQGEADVAQG